MYVLALEASTQSAKAAVVDAQGRSIAQASAPYPPHVSDIATMDASGVFDTLMAVGREAVCSAVGAGIDAQAIRAGALCTIWQSLLPLDAHFAPLMRATTWADTASGDVAHAIRNDTAHSRDYYRRTGCIPHSQLPVLHAAHLRRAQPDLFKNTRFFASLGSYLLYRMTGACLSSRCTMAGSGWLNLGTLAWDPLALSIAQINEAQLPPLCDATDAFPLLAHIAHALGVSTIPLAAGGGDGGLNQIGSGALRDGVMTASVGTSGALRVASRTPLLTDPPSTWCYYADQGWYIAGAATSGASNCVDWVRHNMLAGAPFAQLEAAMHAVRPQWQSAPIFLPFLWGERCPGWQDDRTGGFVGLRGEHGAGDLYYAALEGVLMLLRLCYDRLTPLSGAPDLLTLSGGITHSLPWMQMACDIFHRPIEISPQANASLMGAAALAQVAAGQLGNLHDFPTEKGHILQPDPSATDHYQQRFMRFQEAYS